MGDERENFLERWSRRKREAESATRAERQAPQDTPQAARPVAVRSAAPAGATSTKAAARPSSQPEFDLASLPPLDSITAATDIRAFLAPGVPAELARAALRRAWAADPAIRDFVGLQEYAWDFTDPNGVLGFGELPPGYDVKGLIARVVGEEEWPATSTPQMGSPRPPDLATPVAGGAGRPEPSRIGAANPQESARANHDPTAGQAPESSPPVAMIAATPNSKSMSAEPGIVSSADLVHRDSMNAAHNSEPLQPTAATRPRRSHGRALPR